MAEIYTENICHYDEYTLAETKAYGAHRSSSSSFCNAVIILSLGETSRAKAAGRSGLYSMMWHYSALPKYAHTFVFKSPRSNLLISLNPLELKQFCNLKKRLMFSCKFLDANQSIYRINCRRCQFRSISVISLTKLLLLNCVSNPVNT